MTTEQDNKYKTLKGYIPLIKNNPLFDGIPENELVEVFTCLDPIEKRYRKAELIVRAGDPFTGIGLLLEGSLLITKENIAGERTVLDILIPGQIFGEMAAFSSYSVWPANAEANSDCLVIFLKTHAITGMCSNACSRHLLLIKNLLKIISEKALNLSRRVNYLTLKSMRAKLSTYIFEQHINNGSSFLFNLPLNRNELAEFLCVSRPSMSREMSRMKQEGIIDFHCSSIKILDLKKLKNSTLH